MGTQRKIDVYGASQLESQTYCTNFLVPTDPTLVHRRATFYPGDSDWRDPAGPRILPAPRDRQAHVGDRVGRQHGAVRTGRVLAWEDRRLGPCYNSANSANNVALPVMEKEIIRLETVDTFRVDSQRHKF